jgi:hypothetical protein
MAEWHLMRDTVSFEQFAVEVGMRLDAWKRMYDRACALDDPRAVGRYETARRAVAA